MVKIDEYEFEGLYASTDGLKNEAGIYIVVCSEGNKFRVIDVGESDEVKNRIGTHERKDCWKRNCSTENIKFGVFYTPNLTEEKRREIEKEIRNSPNRDVPCGKE